MTFRKDPSEIQKKKLGGRKDPLGQSAYPQFPCGHRLNGNGQTGMVITNEKEKRKEKGGRKKKKR